MDLHEVYNPDGMAARYSYAVWDGEELLALDLIGAESAVKALHATIAQGKWLTPRGPQVWGRKRIAGAFETVRTALEERPLLCRWHVVPAASENALAIPVYGWEADLPAAAALVGALARWTVWPALPEWGDTLARLGRAQNLVRQVEATGVDYAFVVATEGWGDLLDRAIRDGDLRFPEEAAA